MCGKNYVADGQDILSLLSAISLLAAFSPVLIADELHSSRYDSLYSSRHEIFHSLTASDGHSSRCAVYY